MSGTTGKVKPRLAGDPDRRGGFRDSCRRSRRCIRPVTPEVGCGERRLLLIRSTLQEPLLINRRRGWDGRQLDSPHRLLGGGG